MNPLRLCVPLLLIVLAASLTYGNALSVPFVFDGKEVIQDTLAFKDFFVHFSWEKLLRSRAIVDASFAVNYQLGRVNVFGYQLLNVVIHTINGVLACILSFVIFTRFSSKSATAASFLSGLVFISHPIQTQAVTYAIQRYTSVAAMFYMGSVLFFLRARLLSGMGRKSQVCGLYLGAMLCGIAAFLSKPNTATLPIAIFLSEYFVVGKASVGWRKKNPWIFLFPVCLVCFLFGVSMIRMEGDATNGLLEQVSSRLTEIEGASRWSYLCTQFNVIAIYIKLLLFPFQQNIDYMYPFKRDFWDGNTPLAFLFLSAVAGWGGTIMKKSPVVAFGVFWFFVSLMVESSIIPIRDPLFEHRLYLPMVGFSLILSHQWFNGSKWTARYFPVMSMMVVFLFCVGTNLRNETWADPMKLWSDSVAKNPKNFRGHNNLGELLMAKNQFPEALEHFSRAAEIVPIFPEAHYNMGLVYGKMERPREAVTELRMAKHLGMRSLDFHHHLGFYCGKSGLWDEAVQEYLLALKLNPRSSQIHSDLCVAYFRLGQYGDAINECEKSIDLDPASYFAYSNLGNIYLALKRYPEAVKEFQIALRLNPDLREARYYLGLAWFQQGLLAEAEKEWTSVLDLYPGYGEVAQALRVLKRAGDK